MSTLARPWAEEHKYCPNQVNFPSYLPFATWEDKNLNQKNVKSWIKVFWPFKFKLFYKHLVKFNLLKEGNILYFWLQHAVIRKVIQPSILHLTTLDVCFPINIILSFTIKLSSLNLPKKISCKNVQYFRIFLKAFIWHFQKHFSTFMKM
jgi:hypothetical protein